MTMAMFNDGVEERHDPLSDLLEIQALNVLPMPVLVIGEGHGILYANTAAEDFFQASAIVLKRQRLDDLVAFGSPVLTLVQEVQRRGASVSEYRLELASPRLGLDRVVDVVPELAGTTVAVETEYPADPAGLVVMVHMLRIGRPTGGADAALRGEHLVHLLPPDAVASAQVRPGAATEPSRGLPGAGVVARLTVASVPLVTRRAASEVDQRRDCRTVRTVPVAGW